MTESHKTAEDTLTNAQSISGFGYAKALIFGEYAVMYGAKALVVAIDTRLSVHLSNIRIPARTQNAHNAGQYTPDITLKLRHLLNHPQGFKEILDDVTSVAIDADIRLDDSAFFDKDGEKLGIGSSAAITVALLEAQLKAAQILHGIQVSQSDAIKAAIQTHRMMQNNMGSGADVIASAIGGAQIVHNCPDNPQIQSIPSSHLPHFALLVTHQQAPTCSYIQAARNHDKTPEFRQIIQHIANAGESAAKSLLAQNKAEFLSIMDAFPDMLGALGKIISMPIVPPLFHDIAPIAKSSGVVLKTSGAGGGDIFIAFANDREKLNDFVHSIPGRFNISVLDTNIAPARSYP